MDRLRLKNNLRGDLEGFLAIFLSGKKIRNKVKKAYLSKEGTLIVEGVLSCEE